MDTVKITKYIVCHRRIPTDDRVFYRYLLIKDAITRGYLTKVVCIAEKE